MKFIFIDETIKNKKKRSFLGLCGVIVDSDNLLKLELDIKRFKKKYGFTNLKDFRKPFNQKEKLNITEKLFNILDKNEVVIISSVIGQKTLEKN